MKTVTFTVLALVAVSLSQADNDGRYHPELYDGSFKSLTQRNGKYGSIYNAYQQPFNYQALNSAEQAPAAPATVTYRTLVAPFAPTNRPFVSSTAKPYAVSTKRPAAIYQKSISDGAASVIREDRTFDENNYHYAFETNNGIAAEESGVVEASHNGVGGGTRVRGFYEYIGDDGLKYRVDYVADENGFRASGAHLPKAP